jgi:voltage-gated potassium channel
MTTAAHIAVAAGVAMMVVLTIAPAYEAAHHWVDAVLWACLACFVFEWTVRLRHMAKQHRLLLYTFSSSGIVDAIGALAVPVALISGVEPGRRGCSASSGC